MKHYILIIILSLCFMSCNRHSKHWETITSMETIIEERPDSVLNILQAIDADELVIDKERAKHALLLSLAMDKTNTLHKQIEILQPAIEYYTEKGSATDLIRILYIKGQIHNLNGQYAQALTCYCNAIDKAKYSDNTLIKADLFTAQGDIYILLTQWDEAINSKVSALDYFNSLDCTDGYVNCLLDLFYCYTQSGDYNNAQKYLKQCNNHIEVISNAILSKFYSHCLNSLIKTGEFDKIESTIQEYLSKVSEENIDYLSIASAYAVLGDINKVGDALTKVELTDDTKDILYQYAIVKAINEYVHDGRNVLEAYKEALVERDSTIYSIYENDIQYMLQKHNEKIQLEQEKLRKRTKTIITISCIFALIAALSILNVVRKRLRDSRTSNVLLMQEKQKYEQLYADAIAERNVLAKIINDSSVKEEAKAVIKARLDVLNKVIISQITGTISANKKAAEELDSLLADKDNFIESTRLTIEGNKPEFITTLKKYGLTDEEINICCLYAIGLKGKDIKAYTSQPRHYNQSADIRHKLGLTENDTNLSIFLREMHEK